MGGELHQCSTVCLQAVRRRHNTKCFCALRAGSNAVLTVKYAGAGPHPSRSFPACPWKICVAASRLPCLLCLYADGAMAGECFPSCSCSWNFCVHALHVPYTILSLQDKADPHTMKNISRRMWVCFCVCDTSTKGSRRKARHKTVREYRQAHRTRPAFVAGQFVRAALYLCGLPRIRSPAKRRDDVRPLEKETVRFP